MCSSDLIQTIVLLFTVLIPISSFSYPQSSYLLSKDEYYSVSPIIQGTDHVYSITSGSLPQGLSIDSSSGIISGIPQSVTDRSVTIKAFNQVSNRSFAISFSVLTPISSFSYSQSSYIIPRDVSFSVTPSFNGDQVSFSITSGSLPQGLSINPSNGVISGTPISSTNLINITIQAHNQVGSTQFSISFIVLIPLSNLHYPQLSFSLIKHQSFSISPSITGDHPFFNITSGILPSGLTLNSSNGMISGIPSSSTPSSSITIEASNELGSIDTQLSFVVKSLSTLSIILISLVILIIIIIVIIMIIVILSKKKKPTLPKKSLEEVKSVEKRVVNHAAPAAPAVPAPDRKSVV